MTRIAVLMNPMMMMAGFDHKKNLVAPQAWWFLLFFMVMKNVLSEGFSSCMKDL